MSEACRYAQPDGAGWVYCRSRLVKFAPGGFPLVKESRCETCTVKNRVNRPRPEVRLQTGKWTEHFSMPRVVADKPAVDRTYPCIHRGDQVGEKRKENCCGGKRPRIKIFKCLVRGQCSMETDVGVAVCAGCADRKP